MTMIMVIDNDGSNDDSNTNYCYFHYCLTCPFALSLPSQTDV